MRNRITLLKHISSFIFMLLASRSDAQTIDKKYRGWWGDTQWTFEFKRDGSFERSSAGHYGSTHVFGKYEVKADTIHLLSGFQNTDGTLNEYYLIDQEGYIIDLRLLYDYQVAKKGNSVYNSRMRNEYKAEKKDK
jgi:hypothetical protein